MIQSQPNEKMTVIVPVYNEEACLPAFRGEMERFLSRAPMEAQILFVNDGSSDRSFEIMQQICREDGRFAVISLETNRGLSAALKAGIDHCQSALIGYIDADLQTRADDFLVMLPHLPEYDMVNGVRQKRQDTPVKRISSLIANSFRKAILADGMQDTCCPLKIIKAEYARKIPFFNGMHRFLPALVQMQGGKVQQVAVGHRPRYAGTAKYHLANRLIGPFVDTLAVLWMKRRWLRYRVRT